MNVKQINIVWQLNCRGCECGNGGKSTSKRNKQQQQNPMWIPFAHSNVSLKMKSIRSVPSRFDGISIWQTNFPQHKLRASSCQPTRTQIDLTSFFCLLLVVCVCMPNLSWEMNGFFFRLHKKKKWFIFAWTLDCVCAA